MKVFLAALIALAVAAVLAVAIQYDSGYILLAFGHTTVEMTLWVGLALLLLSGLLLWLLASLLRRSARLSGRLGVLRGERRTMRERQRSQRGVIAYAQGNWLQAKRLLLSSVSSDKPLANYLLAARACQRLGDDRGMAQALDQARACGTQAEVAAALTLAELQLDSGQAGEALTTLAGLGKGAERHPATLLLLARAHRARGDWQALLELLPVLNKRQLLLPKQRFEWEMEALRGQLQRLRQEGDAGALLKWWQQLGRSNPHRSPLLEDMIPALLALGCSGEASKLVRGAIKQQWRDELVLLYAGIRDDDPASQLRSAESWLKDQPNNPQLLLALGRICLRNELWGKAREYLEQAHHLSPSATVCFELSRLLEHLGEAEKAAGLLREGLMLQGQQLPDLPMPQLSHRL